MKNKLITVHAAAFIKKIKYLLCIGLLLAFANAALAQKEKNICGITSAYSTFVNKRVVEKIAALKASGKYKAPLLNSMKQANALATPVSFRFPLADIRHRDYASWRMFNYVDLDPTSIDDGINYNPNEIEDYNCGDRTYDYHSGIDILLEPYYWKEKADQSIWVIAAAPGVIVDKHDGAFDEQCDPPASICGSEPDNRGNYIVILHDDGSTASFYMHMIQNSITSKQEGDRVNAGDYLGIAGSSGCSSAPHLHFEVRTGYIDEGLGYEATGTVVDPFANGSCAVSPSSWWINEPPYDDPAILTMDTHSADPESFVEGSDWCDQTVLLYPDNTFSAGQNVYMRTKFRDWRDGSTVTFNIYKPDGTLWRSYTKTNPGGSRGFIPSDAIYGFTSLDPVGTYRYTVTFGGKTYSHYFTKDCQPSLGLSGAVSGQKGYMVSNFISSFQTISGTSANYIKYMADGHVTLSPGFRATSGCRFVANTEGCNNSTSSFNKIAETETAVALVKDNAADKIQTGLTVFPNPSAGVFTVRYSNNQKFTASVTVRNMLGQVVYAIAAREFQNELLQRVNLTGKPKGIYLVEILSGDKRISSKVLIQ
ncbi:MAG TPA: peptidoglycan DD-metalloendopeptidase family protein [Panacibacter sp.]|nr:peptidoglycan DD-metalloendopeptidase family protein [Panacibacter sp.]